MPLGFQIKLLTGNSFIFPKQIILWLYVTYSIFKFKNKIKYKISVGKTFFIFLVSEKSFFLVLKLALAVLHVYARQTLHYPFHTINSKTFQQSETNCVQMAEEVNIFFITAVWSYSAKLIKTLKTNSCWGLLTFTFTLMLLVLSYYCT